MTSDAFVSSHPSTIQAIDATMKMMKPATVTRATIVRTMPSETPTSYWLRGVDRVALRTRTAPKR